MNYQILAVEDHPIEQKLLSLLGEQYGFKIRVVHSAKEALAELAGAHPYSLVLMDWSMPRDGDGMNGLECTRTIRKLEEGGKRRLPIIAVTAHAMLGDKSKCLEAGMDDYLSKPYTPEEFQQKISSWLNYANKLIG